MDISDGNKRSLKVCEQQEAEIESIELALDGLSAKMLKGTAASIAPTVTKLSVAILGLSHRGGLVPS